MRRHLDILDTRWRLEAPENVLGGIASAYDRFQGDDDPSGRCTVRLDDGGPIRVDGHAVAWVDAIDPTLQFYRRFLLELTRRLESHGLLHAGSLLAPDGRVLIIAGPSGYGKSSLTLALLNRGFRFLSDDYAPLDLDRREVAPYPRRVGLIEENAAHAPSAFRQAVQQPGPSLLGKRLIDVAEVYGEAHLVAQARPLGHVVALGRLDTAEDWISGATRLQVAAVPSAGEELDCAFRAIEGVRVEAAARDERLAHWTLQLDASARPTQRLMPLLESESIVFYEKSWGRAHDFTSAPRVRPLQRSKTAELLGRELLNRRADGRLIQRVGGPTALFVELAGALREVSCHQVEPGPLEATADLVRDLTIAG